MPLEKQPDDVALENVIDRPSVPSVFPALNPDDYRQDLSSFDLTKEQEDAFLEALWQIMKTMVEIGWGVDTVQLLLPELFEESARNQSRKGEHANE